MSDLNVTETLKSQCSRPIRKAWNALLEGRTHESVYY